MTKGRYTYTYYEVRINGRTYARFEELDHANGFVEYHKTLRGGIHLKYEVVPVERRSL